MAMAAVARLISSHSLPPSLSPHGLHSRRPPKPPILVAAQSIGPAIPGHGDQPSPSPFRLPFAPLVAPPPPLSEIVWPAAGAFAAMAFMGALDKLLEPRGLTFTIAPFGAVSALLFAAPQAPAARKYNVFLSHMGCAALGVAALAVFGPGWIARSVALAASVAFMQFTGCFHPPAAGLPLLFIDGPKFHHLQWLYVLFPGAAGCVLLCLLQEVVAFLRKNCRF